MFILNVAEVNVCKSNYCEQRAQTSDLFVLSFQYFSFASETKWVLQRRALKRHDLKLLFRTDDELRGCVKSE